MTTKFFTNEGSNTLLNKFKGVFENNKDIEMFDDVAVFFEKEDYYKCIEIHGVGLLKGQNILHIPYKAILDLEFKDEINSNDFIDYTVKNVPGAYKQ